MANVGGLIFGSDQPEVDDGADNTTYCMGTKFSSDIAGKITQIHWRSPLNSPGGYNSAVLPIKAQLWKFDENAIVGSGTFTSLLGNQWEHLTVDWDIEPGVNYMYSIITDRYTATPHYFDSPITSGHITAPTSAGKFRDQGISIELTVPPSDSFNAGGYFLDFDFVPASSGLLVSVWNGTSELEVESVSVWNGTSEVPAVVDSVV